MEYFLFLLSKFVSLYLGLVNADNNSILGQSEGTVAVPIVLGMRISSTSLPTQGNFDCLHTRLL